QGMAHWLSMELAGHFGIAANLDFPFPSSYVWRVFRQQYRDIPEASRFDKPALRWRVLECLPHCLKQPGFELLQGYLHGDQSGLKAYQLAQRIADIFDQYLIYRPDWLLSWEAGEAEHWQARLWRLLTEGEGEPHRARLHQRFMQDLQRGRIKTEGLPPRLCLFGISSLPQTYLDVLAGLSVVTEVHLFMHNPSLAYWGDIVSEKELAR
ncbi:MAG: exonuclease V subunit gamma, partial [Anaerolineae bacterium]|nr:exonuclease V subunit gamma [Anaerolineae bacterium]